MTYEFLKLTAMMAVMPLFAIIDYWTGGNWFLTGLAGAWLIFICLISTMAVLTLRKILVIFKGDPTLLDRMGANPLSVAGMRRIERLANIALQVSAAGALWPDHPLLAFGCAYLVVSMIVIGSINRSIINLYIKQQENNTL